MSNSDLVIFDLGGVLVRNIDMLSSISRELSIDESALRADYALYEKAMMAGLFSIGDYYRHMEDRFHVDIPCDIFRIHFRPVLNPAMTALADDLRSRGMRCVIGSNTFQSHWWVIDELDIRRHFDACHASHIIHAVKPEPGFFRTILAIEEADARRTHFIDDSKVNVDAASLLGIDTWRYDDDDDALYAHFRGLPG